MTKEDWERQSKTVNFAMTTVWIILFTSALLLNGCGEGYPNRADNSQQSADQANSSDQCVNVSGDCIIIGGDGTNSGNDNTNSGNDSHDVANP